MWSLSPLLGVKIVHFLDRSDLFKISNLVCDGREIVRILYSSLQGQRQFMVGIVNHQVFQCQNLWLREHMEELTL